MAALDEPAATPERIWTPHMATTTAAELQHLAASARSAQARLVPVRMPVRVRVRVRVHVRVRVRVRVHVQLGGACYTWPSMLSVLVICMCVLLSPLAVAAVPSAKRWGTAL